MKNKKLIIVLIILLSIIMIALSILFVDLLQSDFKFKGFRIGLQTSNDLILDKTYEEEFTSKIFIKKSNTEKIKLVIYGEKENTKVENNLDSLNIEINGKNCLGFCFKQKLAKIELSLPEKYTGNINIKNEYGDISIDKFLNANIDVQEDNGDVKILGGNIIKVNNNYGDIEINNANISNINAECGDV